MFLIFQFLGRSGGAALTRVLDMSFLRAGLVLM